MGLRFQKRIPLLKGLTLNLSKTGASVTLGKKGASINIGKDGVTGNAGIPGSGLSYREKLSGKSTGGLANALLWLVVIAAIGLVLGGKDIENVLQRVMDILKG